MAEQLKLKLDPPEPFPNGLSGWLRGRPPFIGWWDTRLILEKNAVRLHRVPLIDRRWWSAVGWSQPVMFPEDEVAALLAKNCPAAVSWSMIEFRGLAEPPKEGYPWALDDHHRSNMAVASRARTPLAV